MLLEITNSLIKKFKINIEQIRKCTDNTYEDLKNEAYIIVHDNIESILNNERVFINELKTKCLRFNKYGKRIESKERFEKFNEYENNMVEESDNEMNMDEDKICMLVDIKELIGEDNYNFLLDYYNYGAKTISYKYGISECSTRKRASNLVKKIRDKLM